MSRAFQVTGSRTRRAFQVVEGFEIPSGGGGPQKPDLEADASAGIPVTPTGIRANWSQPSYAVVEGNSIIVTARLSQTSATQTFAAAVTATGSTTTDVADYDLGTAEFVWQPGEQEATLEITTTGTAGSTSDTLLQLTFDNSVELSDPLYERAGDPLAPSAFLANITILDAVVATPTFRWPLAAASVDENSARTFPVLLTSPATDVVTIRATTVADTATVTRDYIQRTEDIVFQVGEQQKGFTVTFPANTVAVGTDPIVDLTLTLVSGTATAGSPTTIAVTIVDDDGETPRVNFNPSGNLTLIEGGEFRTITATLTDSNGNLVASPTPAEIPLTFAGDTDSIETDFGSGPDDTLVFEAGSPQASFLVRALEDDPGLPVFGEQVTVSINEPPATGPGAGAWIVGTANQRVFLLQEDEPDLTSLFHPEMTGDGDVRVLRQFAVGFEPAVSTLPDLMLDNGEAVQVVGHRRDADGDWVSGYVYCLDEGDASLPNVSGATARNFSAGTGTTPAEIAGGGTPTSPTVNFQISIGELDTFEADTSAFAEKIDWTSGTGEWEQTGPNICTEAIYRWRPFRNGTTPAQDAVSGDRAGMLELVEQKIAGEDDVIIYEGRFYNGATAAGQDQRAENPYNDGRMWLGDDARIAVQLEAGWRVEVFDAHPWQRRVGSSDEQFYLLDNSATSGGTASPHLFREGQSYHFWFVARRVSGSPDAGALARAEEYWDQKHISWAVGPRGSTRVPFLGEAGELSLDWSRAGLTRDGREGWEAVQYVADGQMTGTPSLGTTYKAAWTGGLGGPDGDAWGQGSYSRAGWLHTILPDRGGATGGVGIYGCHGFLPAYSQWYRMRTYLAGAQGRMNINIRDCLDGEAMWWWKVTGTDGGETRAGSLTSMADGPGTFHTLHFLGNSTEAPVSDLVPSGVSEATVTANGWRLSPSTRDWNSTPALNGGTDPNLARRDLAEPINITHAARLRLGYLDRWICCRSALAYRCWEETAAWMTRAMTPLEPFADIRSTFVQYSNRQSLWVINEGNAASGSNAGIGVWYPEGGNFAATTGNHRGYGWLMLCVGGFYAFAKTATRAELRGTGPGAVAAGGHDWFEEVARFLGYMMTPTGGSFLSVNEFNQFDSWKDDEVGPTNLTARTGALPSRSYDPPGSGTPDAVDGAAFRYWQYTFVTRGFYACTVNSGVDPATASGRTEATEIFRWVDWLTQSLRANGTPQTQRVINWVLSIVSESVRPNRSQTPPTPITQAEAQEGAIGWPAVRLGETAAIGWSNQNNKSGWVADVATRYFADDLYTRNGLYPYAIQDGDFESWLDGSVGGRPMNRILGRFQGGNAYTLYSEESFLVPFAAYLLNRVS